MDAVNQSQGATSSFFSRWRISRSGRSGRVKLADAGTPGSGIASSAGA